MQITIHEFKCEDQKDFHNMMHMVHNVWAPDWESQQKWIKVFWIYGNSLIKNVPSATTFEEFRFFHGEEALIEMYNASRSSVFRKLYS